MTHFPTFSQSPSPQAPWHPSQKMLLIMAMSLDKVSSRLDQMAPHSCPFFVSNFDIFSTTPKKHVWALWESPGGGKEIFFFSFSICFLVGFDLKSISFPPPGDLNVLESSNRTKGWPPCGAQPFVRGFCPFWAKSKETWMCDHHTIIFC